MKKYIYWDLFHLSLVLSLLRLYPNLYRRVTWDAEPYGHEVFLGDSTAYTQARFHNLNNNQLNAFIHPKNLDDAIERSIFIHDINSLCRRPAWNCNSPRRETNIFAYIVNGLQPQSVDNSAQDSQEPETSEAQTDIPTTASELTQADMDLIEVLWKQDIDMGVAREVFDGTWKPKDANEKVEQQASGVSSVNSSFPSPWQGLNYSIDSETGEHIILPGNESSNAAALVPNNLVSIEEALSFFDTQSYTEDLKLNDGEFGVKSDDKSNDLLSVEDFLLGTDLPGTSSSDQNQSLLQQLEDLQEMVSEAQIEHFPEQFSTYTNVTSNYTGAENTTNAILDVLLQNTTLALPMNDSLLDAPYNSGDDFSMPHDTNINSLLSFLTNDSDPNPVGAVGGQEHNDLCPDLPIGNFSVDNTFLSQLMNEASMDFTDFCDLPTNSPQEKNWPASTSSDSAVSSMGSDWSDSCSAESSCSSNSVVNPDGTNSIDFSFSGFASSDAEEFDLEKPAPTTPTKKYHFFGKQHLVKNYDEDDQFQRVPGKVKLQSTSPDKEFCSSITESSGQLPHLAIMHNHTYHHTGNGDAFSDKGASHKPLERDKPKSSSEGTIRGTRDEKRLRNANLPLSVKEIVDLPIELFNERLAQLNLSAEHAALIRDIRRRGKNKMAARTCRKRKVEQITDLESVLDNLQHKRELMCEDVEKAIAQRDLLKQKYQRLYQFIFPDRDPPEPIPSSLYFQEDSVVPPSSFPLCTNTTSVNDNEHKKRGKHKGANRK